MATGTVTETRAARGGQPPAGFDADRAWAAVVARDGSARDFVYGVATTGIFCRCGCPSRHPAREHVRFFATAGEARRAGFRACRRCRPEEMPADARLARAMAGYLEEHFDRRVTLAELGRVSGRSPFTAQRVFRRVLGVTPAGYQRQARAARLRRELEGVKGNVTDAVYAAGYAAASRAYEPAGDALGMSPGNFQRGGRKRTIRYCTGGCELGTLLVARTERGVCAVALGEEPVELVADLRRRFREAVLVEDHGLTGEMQAVAEACRGNAAMAADLPLDLRATAFQMRVWEALRRIPRGETRSYAAVAREIGNPGAARAVARACAANPAALLVPCHRVVGSDGTLAGYRWGVERKRKLLALESGRAGASGEEKILP